MNKFQTAYNRIEYLIYKLDKYGQFDDLNKMLKDFEVEKDFETIQELVDKTTPKKVLNKRGGWYCKIGDCPNCNQKVWKKVDLFHHNKKSCFQRLDWSKDE